MCVTAKRDCCSAFLLPPANDLCVKRHLGVDLQCPTGVGKCSQCVPKFILEGVRIIRPGLRWPVANRVVDVRENAEDVATDVEVGQLEQVLTNDLGRWQSPVELWHLAELVVDR